MNVLTAIKKGIKVTWGAFNNSDYEKFHESSSIRPEETLRQYTLLKYQGIRCKLHQRGLFGIPGMNPSTTILRVHKDDLLKARRLIHDLPH